MKILNSISQLWEQCTLCPLCKRDNRIISIERSFNDVHVVHWKKIDSLIKMRCNMDGSRKYKKAISLSINCDSNAFDYEFSADDKPSDMDFLFIGHCPCNRTFSTGTFSLNMNEKRAENIQINKDSIHIFSPEGNYHISLLYYSNLMLVTKCTFQDENSFIEGDVREFPLMDLDFSQPERVLNKIKTLLLFS